ncbi:MAG: hypothetical protein ACXAC2_22095, partial [Candidatus Kariarchaeaceae archaeon]
MKLAIEPSEDYGLEELEWPDQIENGIGRKTQQILNSQYYNYLDKINKTKEKPIAYMFVGGNLVELLRTLGFEVVYPEITA